MSMDTESIREAEPSVISAHGVTMSFGRGGDKQTVLEGLDITIEAGAFVTLLGPSGCGKSTLLKILGGMLEPTSGDVRIGGDSAAIAVKSQQIGFVPQKAALLPWRSAMQNAKMLREIANAGRDDASTTSAAVDALELVGLADAHSKYPHELSGGMAQRVSIARALAMEPAILMMDEPFGALDAITRDEMNEKLAEIWATTGKTIVFVTHSITEAVFLSDTVHVMGINPGRIIETIPVPLERPRTRDVFHSPIFIELTTHLRELLEPKAVS